MTYFFQLHPPTCFLEFLIIRCPNFLVIFLGLDPLVLGTGTQARRACWSHSQELAASLQGKVSVSNSSLVAVPMCRYTQMP